ncbi:MAG: c-type cytochrome [Acidobacteria bacterium]|nr:c-type cytochrome [Acidobacteriota bacterium]
MKLRLAVVAVFACLFAASWGWKSSAQQPAGGGAAQHPANAPAEQVYKNIQVLKGMPADQLGETMNFFASSLGVNCGFCHARNAAGDGLDFVSDAKEEKKTARAMIAMQMDVNSHHLAAFDNERISCYTCHQGHAGAPHMPRLPLAAPSLPPGNGPGSGQGASSGQPGTPAGQPPAAGAPAQGGQTPLGGAVVGQPAQPPRPTAEQVLAKYVAAVGGADAVAKLKTLVMRGTREGARGGATPYEVTVATPDRLYVVATIPAQGQQTAGEVRQGLNGASGGWTTNARGARALNAAELADLRNVSRYLMPLKLAQPFPQMTVRGRGRVADAQAWVLEATPAPDVKQYFFFDQQSGLLLRQLTIRSLFLFDVPEQVDYEDYRDVDGVKLPFTVRSSSVNVNNPIAIRKFTDIKANAPIQDSIFVMPAATPQP